MMKKKLLTLVVLLSISFSVVHAYVIEALDTHECHVSEYVHNINDADNSLAVSDDICHLHHFFHISFILPEIKLPLLAVIFNVHPLSYESSYEYDSYDNFLKPPINA
jgi:hypothetical protein